MFLLAYPPVSWALDRLGLACRWRASMVLQLRELVERPTVPNGYQITPWDPARLRDVAEVDYRAYAGGVDAELYRNYLATAEGCERMWREAMRGRFGRFDPLRTRLLLRDGQVCGDVMASQRGHRDGFIGNLAVLPSHQGGTGRALLLSSLWAFREAGFERVTLAVSLENARALRLYQRLGFEVTGRFPIVTRRVPLPVVAQ